MSIDRDGFITKIGVDCALDHLPPFPVDGAGKFNASRVAAAIGKPVEFVAEMDPTEARARWYAVHTRRWAMAFLQQVKEADEAETIAVRRMARRTA